MSLVSLHNHQNLQKTRLVTVPCHVAITDGLLMTDQAKLAIAPALPEGGGSPAPACARDVPRAPELVEPMWWQALFSFIGGTGDRCRGILNHHPTSRWITVRDEEEDILVGRYLRGDEHVLEGVHMVIDVFEISIGCPITQGQQRDSDPIDIVDLTTMSLAKELKEVVYRMAAVDTNPEPNLWRIGGLFWIFTEGCEDEDLVRFQGRRDAADRVTAVHVIVDAEGVLQW